MKNYGILSKPLTELLKKRNFSWGPEAERAFEELKRVMSGVLILRMPDFSKPFVLETDACGTSVGVILVQEGRPLAFLSQALGPKHVGLSIYEKEFFAILIAIEK